MSPLYPEAVLCPSRTNIPTLFPLSLSPSPSSSVSLKITPAGSFAAGFCLSQKAVIFHFNLNKGSLCENGCLGVACTQSRRKNLQGLLQIRRRYYLDPVGNSAQNLDTQHPDSGLEWSRTKLKRPCPHLSGFYKKQAWDTVFRFYFSWGQTIRQSAWILGALSFNDSQFIIQIKTKRAPTARGLFPSSGLTQRRLLLPHFQSYLHLFLFSFPLFSLLSHLPFFPLPPWS